MATHTPYSSHHIPKITKHSIPLEIVAIVGVTSAVCTFGGYVAYKELFKDNQVSIHPREDMFKKYHKEASQKVMPRHVVLSNIHKLSANKSSSETNIEY